MPGFRRGIHVFFSDGSCLFRIAGDRVLTFVGADAISASPGTSGLLAFGMELQ
jgi:hypothetical protein